MSAAEQAELFPADQVLPLWWLVPNAQDVARVEPVELDDAAEVER